MELRLQVVFRFPFKPLNLRMAVKGRGLPTSPAVGVVQASVGATPISLPDQKKLAASDFYGALQRSLDALQRRLSNANNAFADFVVKEFKIDAAVQIQVNELGVL